MKLAFDLDEVIADGLSSFLPYYNKKHATNFSYNDMCSNDFAIAFNTPQIEIQESVIEFYQSDIPIAPMAHAKEVINNLKSNHELVIVTSRPPGLEKATYLWLEREFPNIFSTVYFSHNFHIGCGRKTKLEQCMENKLDLLVDDTLEHLLPCARQGIVTLLYSQIWNQGEVPDQIRRVDSWLEVEKTINEIKQT